jgi:hypothetical protein
MTLNEGIPKVEERRAKVCTAQTYCRIGVWWIDFSGVGVFTAAST